MEVSEKCAWCEAPKVPGPVCPECGADYAKAAAIKQHGRATAAAPQPAPAAAPAAGFSMEVVSSATGGIEDPALERTLRRWALPAMLTGAFTIQLTGFGAALQRIVLGMPVHELGHATVAWFCGYNAIPTVWKTITASERGLAATVLVFAGIVALYNYGRRTLRSGWRVFAAGLLILQVTGTFLVGERTADELIVFGGDAGGMVLATLLMGSFYFGSDTQLYRGGLRWGFLFIGAAAFADMFMTWWRALGDRLAVPYGLTGGEPTDAFKLINYHTWSWEQLIGRHVAVGVICLAFLFVLYVWGLRQANRLLEVHAKQETSEP